LLYVVGLKSVVPHRGTRGGFRVPGASAPSYHNVAPSGLRVSEPT
jgi:hypothetical protein